MDRHKQLNPAVKQQGVKVTDTHTLTAAYTFEDEFTQVRLRLYSLDPPGLLADNMKEPRFRCIEVAPVQSRPAEINQTRATTHMQMQEPEAELYYAEHRSERLSDICDSEER